MDTSEASETLPTYADHRTTELVPAITGPAPPDLFRSRSRVDSLLSAVSDAETESLCKESPVDLTLPPSYRRCDPEARIYAFHPPFVSSKHCLGHEPSAPRFQLSQVISSLGKPFKLSLRRLTPSESRRISIGGPSSPPRPSLAAWTSAAASSSCLRRVVSASASVPDYDHDLTLYEATNVNALHRFTPVRHNPEIRGCKAGTLPGHIELADVARSGTCRFWHVTPQPQAALEAARAKMTRWGYKPDEEWRRRVLFTVEKQGANLVWRDGDTGRKLASEVEGQLEVESGMELSLVEALVACAACRGWILGWWDWGR
ncbi:hypothetical protein HYQ46_007804 [Verticillium longisporum]|nr:hypothetical protein HYQ46_007804 [Verticillium longisporum]